MTKEDEFLWIVQTAVLSNSIHLATKPESRERYLHVYSSTGVRITMREAVRASGLIPADMEAADAADNFCTYMLENLRDDLDPEDQDKTVPDWFARY